MIKIANTLSGSRQVELGSHVHNVTTNVVSKPVPLSGTHTLFQVLYEGYFSCFLNSNFFFPSLMNHSEQTTLI